MTIYNPNVDLVNDNVHTKVGHNKSIRFQDIEYKPNSDVNQGRYSVANLRKATIYNTNVDLVNDNVYTKFGLNRFQDIEQKLYYDGYDGLTE